MKALFVCRLQPLHNGHLHAIKKILEKYDSVLIAIGSSQASRERSNPLSFDERKEMLIAVLKSEKILDRCDIVGIPDANDDAKWRGLIEKYDFGVVITGNDWTRRCLSRDYRVEGPDFLEPDKLNATRIRNLIRQGRDWEKLVPGAVFGFVAEKIKSGKLKMEGKNEEAGDW